MAAAARPRFGLLALVVLVTAVHLWLADTVGLDRIGLGAGGDGLPARMQVAFVRELARHAAPLVAPAAASPATPGMLRKPVVAAPAASQPAAAADPPAAPVPVAASVLPDPEPAAPLAAEQPASAAVVVTALAANSAASAAAAAASQADTTAAQAPLSPIAQAWAWPPSTRLSYTLTGDYRGPVDGQAQVEWLLEGSRYQVHMDLSIGPVFAPLASRRVSSEGVVTANGLSPRRYDEVTRALLRQPQRLTVWLDDDQVRLANGRVEPRPAGVQDSASQFVHLTWLFTTQPELLQAGQSVTLPLALPRQLEPWVYDVTGAQTLATPAGEVETFHIKPRRPPRQGNDLTAEIWIAPSLQYLPVRIVIRQDAQTYLDLLIARLPQQAAERR